MLKKNYGLLLKSLLFSLLSACATQPPDKPVCLEFGLDRARCVTIITGQEFIVDDEHKYEGKTWWEMRPTNMSVPASTWVGLKSFIIKVCKKYQNCQDEVSSWDRTIQNIDAQYEAKGP